MTILSDKERTRSLLMNWMFWSRSVKPDPALIYYYTQSPMWNDNYLQGTQDKINDEKDAIEGLWAGDSLFYDKSPPCPVTLITAEEYYAVR